MIEYKDTVISIKPVTVDNFDVSKIRLENIENNLCKNIYYGDDPFYLQTPVLTVNNIFDNLVTGYKIITFIDDNSDNFKKICNVFTQIDNEREKHNFNNNNAITRYKKLISNMDDKIYFDINLDSNPRTLKTSVFINDGNGIPKLCKCDDMADLVKLIPSGSKIRMVMLFDNYEEYLNLDNKIIKTVIIIEYFL